MRAIAALFVQTNGAYFGLEGIDPWDEKRDARKYDGNDPVIAHPPCQLWGALASVNFKRWGGEHNRPENDGGCFEFALKTVQRVGGVLEHPAKTRAWKKYNLTRPAPHQWTKCQTGGWVCEVWQSAYGHKANKATWLYFFGREKPKEINWSRPKGLFQVGHPDHRGKLRNKPTLSKKEANATPEEFKNLLIELARNAA